MRESIKGVFNNLTVLQRAGIACTVIQASIVSLCLLGHFPILDVTWFAFGFAGGMTFTSFIVRPVFKVRFRLFVNGRELINQIEYVDRDEERSLELVSEKGLSRHRNN